MRPPQRRRRTAELHPENDPGQEHLDYGKYQGLQIRTHVLHNTHTHTHTHTEIRAHPRGWRRFLRAPELRGEGHCAHCFCSPCVVDPHFRPDYLKGRCDPHDANRGKRLRLYRRFWRSLTDLGVWRDPEYLLMKADRAARDDVREVMPLCVEMVRKTK